MANFTLARHDSYMDYLNVGIKQVTLTFLRNSPLHMSSLFADHIIAKAEEQIRQHIDRLSSGPSHKKRSRYHPYNQPDKQAPEIWSTSMSPERRSKKGRGKASNYSQPLAKGQSCYN